MAKADILTQGYADGYDIALRVAVDAQKQGKDIMTALQNERRNRGILGNGTRLTNAEYNRQFNRTIIAAYKAALVISLAVLWGEFKWGGIKRLPKFAEGYFNYLIAIGNGDTSLPELVELLSKETGAHIDLKANDYVVDFRRGKGKDKVK